MSAPRPWVIRTQPGPSELLSSYLVRAAHAHGMNPYRFYSFHFPRVCIWNRDIDRSAGIDFLLQLSQHASLTPEEVVDLTLNQWRRVVCGTGMLPPIATGTDPWISSIGIFHRIRHRFGLQFCPQCLAAYGIFKKEWRLSFVTTCSEHGCSLADCCGRCLAPVCFHRNDALLCNCWQCGYPLAKSASGSDAGLEKRQRGQLYLMNALLAGVTPVGEATVESASFFQGLSLLFRTIKLKLASSDQKINFPGFTSCCTGTRFEHERLVVRAEQSLAISGLLDQWPEQLLELASDIKLNQSSFAKREAIPVWLAPTLSLLPTGSRRTRSRKTVPVRLALQRIARNKNEGWRTNRARILLEAAGGGA